MPEPLRRIQFVADRGDARLRLDQVLVRRVTDVARMSRSRAQAWIAHGAVEVDGAIAARASMRVREGAPVAVALPADTPCRLRPQAEDAVLDVIYEDEHLLVVNKPPSVVVHPSYKHPQGTMLNAVLGRRRDHPGSRPGIVTRLDKDTSGLLLVALTSGVHAGLQRQRLSKEYFAIVAGVPVPAAGRIDLPLGRDPDDRRRIVVSDDGQPSVTRYRIERTSGEATLVRCELETGRTHQIRVHLAARGWPILGDRVYGVEDARMARVALHACRLRFTHPVTGAPLDLSAPVPGDMAWITTSPA
jgi:23S rRNA pseudouridine1911/1915/1917 synthase